MVRHLILLSLIGATGCSLALKLELREEAPVQAPAPVNPQLAQITSLIEDYRRELDEVCSQRFVSPENCVAHRETLAKLSTAPVNQSYAATLESYAEAVEYPEARGRLTKISFAIVSLIKLAR